MIISHSKEFVFMRIPKNASNAVACALTRNLKKGDIAIVQPHSDEVDAPGEHTIILPGKENGSTIPSPHINIKILHETSDIVIPEHYMKVVVVRNPYDKFISACINILRRSENAKEGKVDWKNITSDTIKAVYRSVPNSVEFDNYDWFIDGVSPLKIMKFENLQYEFDRVSRSLGLPEEPLDLIYSGLYPQDKYRDLYTPGLRALVERIHKNDFRRFGYEW